MSKLWEAACAAVGLLLAAGTVAGAGARAEEAYSQPAAHDVPRNVYWGDTHLHTRNSLDSYTMGNTGLSPDDAFRFARGGKFTAHDGMEVRLRHPLDFLVVSDHAEYLGVFAGIEDGDKAILSTELGGRWHGYMQAGNSGKMFEEVTALTLSGKPSAIPADARTHIWRSVGEAADRNNRPGVFTAFIGYEWTTTPGGSNLHRNVIFKGDAKATADTLPFSSLDSGNPEDLWAYMERYEESSGSEVLAIPHNGNLSNGLMFASETLSGDPLTKSYAEARMRWEPIYEVTQVKGDGEAHPKLSPTDEFADFETWDTGNFPVEGTRPKTDNMLAHEYARSALKLGLKYEAELGANPFKFGMIGSTDSHTGLSTSEEDNYFGKFPESEPSPERTSNHMMDERWPWANWKLVSSGLAAVWATENTREALFDAMKRKEVYATTGSRIMVRFFGGWDYPADADARPDYVDIGYGGGVPMGGDLTDAPEGKAPSFIIVAAKDPDEANLDRVQVVKGWLDADGASQEKVYDVALSDGRAVDPETGKAPSVGSTVDIENARYTNTIGAALLSATWTDPDFDSTQSAFYYVRVIEIPKPRWTAYDANFFGLDLPDEVPMTVQDRAYTSPIWYTP